MCNYLYIHNIENISHIDSELTDVGYFFNIFSYAIKYKAIILALHTLTLNTYNNFMYMSRYEVRDVSLSHSLVCSSLSKM